MSNATNFCNVNNNGSANNNNASNANGLSPFGCNDFGRRSSASETMPMLAKPPKGGEATI